MALVELLTYAILIIEYQTFLVYKSSLIDHRRHR